MPPFDMGLVQRGARNRRTPYYEATQRSSPKAYTVYNHMYFPVRFDTFENEFQALLNDVTIWDVSVERCIEVSRARRLQVRPARDAAQPLQVRRRPGQVRSDLRFGRGRDQRPGHDAHGREHLLVRPRVLGRPPLLQGPQERLPEAQRHDPRARRGSAAGPGPEVQGPDEGPPRQRASSTSSTTSGARPRSRASPSSSPARDGRARSVTRSTSSTRRRARSSGTRSSRSARSTTSSPRARRTSAASKAASSTGART